MSILRRHYQMMYDLQKLSDYFHRKKHFLAVGELLESIFLIKLKGLFISWIHNYSHRSYTFTRQFITPEQSVHKKMLSKAGSFCLNVSCQTAQQYHGCIVISR